MQSLQIQFNMGWMILVYPPAFKSHLNGSIYPFANNGRHGRNVHLVESPFASFGVEVLCKWLIHGRSSVHLENWIATLTFFYADTVKILDTPSTTIPNKLPLPFLKQI